MTLVLKKKLRHRAPEAHGHPAKYYLVDDHGASRLVMTAFNFEKSLS
jgi:hypothetical protein